MPLAPGTKIGGYDVVALLGAGGMGEVYRARDTRLGRDVAIKILSPAIATDADGLMRFDREARMLASLNHPNIAAIYGFEDGAGSPALILELVDGETLAERVARGPIPVAQALAYARQITDALDTAHEAGIVHRDLKPGNIKITDDGRVKVLDFGLAKAIAAATAPDPAVDPAHSPTVTIHGTKGGVILGTAAYMSPEQARGKTIDKRTDIWAFGCVLYEMLSGRRTFGGETTSDVIAAIIERQPDMTKLPASTPAHIRRVIERCLEKEPKRRARDIAEVRLQLDGDATVHAPQPRRWVQRAVLAAAAVVVAALLGYAAVRWLAATPASAPAPAIEFTLGPPANHRFSAAQAMVSPDGRFVAFGARDAQGLSSLWIRPLDAGAPRRLAGTEGVSGGVWSPDGRALAFIVGDTWKRISVDGGPVVTIVSGVVSNLGASWGSTDTILMAPANRTALAQVPASGGSLTPVTTLDPERENSHRWPQVLPDGRHFLFTVRSDRPDNFGIKISSFGSGTIKPLVRAPSPGKYAEPGWLLFMTPDEVLMAQRLDPKTWTLRGDAQPVAASVRYNGPSFQGYFDVSNDGRVVVYAPASDGDSSLWWFDRTGKPVGKVDRPDRYRGLNTSPDGRVIAVERADERLGTRDIWLIDTTTQAVTRLTSNPATDWRPVFSPDGSSIAFASDRAGASTIFRTSATGAGGETVLYRNPSGGGAFPADWSRDGKYVLANVDDRQGRPNGLVSIPVDGSAATMLIENEPANIMAPRLAPEGDRFAFVSSATGEREVYVMSIADRRRVRVSADGGYNPHWGSDGRELFFQNNRGDIMRAVLERGRLTVGAPPVVQLRPCAHDPNLRFGVDATEVNYDITADGARFFARCDPQDSLPSAVTVIVNWQSKLR
jgi:Tol biopolymer transport system component